MKEHVEVNTTAAKKDNQPATATMRHSVHSVWNSPIDKVRFGLCVGEPLGLQDALALGVEAENLGFDVVTVGENLFWWEPSFAPIWDNFIALTTIANRTNHIRLMTSVIDPVKRHPAVIAHMVATLDHVSSNRFILGIGGGEVGNFAPMVDLAGLPPYRLFTRTKEFIEVLHGVWASTSDDPFSYEGNFFKIEKAYLSLKPVTQPHPPVHIAALGPEMKNLTGRLADGWIPIGHTSETYAKDWQSIKAAAERANRNPQEIDPALWLGTAVLDDGETAKESASFLGRDDLSCNPNRLRELGYPELARAHLAVAQKDRPYEGEELMLQIPRALAERATISGTPKEAIERIEEFIAAGVRLFILMPVYSDRVVVQETLEHYRKTIIPHFTKKARR